MSTRVIIPRWFPILLKGMTRHNNVLKHSKTRGEWETNKWFAMPSLNHEDFSCTQDQSAMTILLSLSLSRTNIHLELVQVRLCAKSGYRYMPKTNKKTEGCRKSTARLVAEGNSSRCLCFMSFFSFWCMSLCVYVNLRVFCTLGVKMPFRISMFVSVCRFDSKSQDSPFLESSRAKKILPKPPKNPPTRS